MASISLYPRLIPTVNISVLESGDVVMLETLCSRGYPNLVSSEDLGLGLDLDFVLPRVSRLEGGRYVLEDTGSDYSWQVRNEVLLKWKSLRASSKFCDVLAAAQKAAMPQIIFSPNGMYPDMSEPASIGMIGKKKLSKKVVRNLLKSLKLVHEDLWPIEQLANVVEPVAKKTRKKPSKSSRKSSKG